MSTFTPPRTIQITLRHPCGGVRLATPTDVPLGDLMPDFLDVVEQPDSDSWAISTGGANPFSDERTLAELGVTDGAVLVLYRRSASLPSSSCPDRPQRAEPSVAVEPPNDRDPADRRADARSAPGTAPPLAAPGSADSERPLSGRTARALPDKLSRPARYLLAVRGLASGAPRSEPRAPVASRTPGPATFTRPAGVSPMARMRKAWRSTQYEHRLDQLVLGLRLQRCATSFTVVATDVDGLTTSATSNYTVIARLGPPVNVVQPSITGTPKAHEKLSCSPGTWTNFPSMYAAQWSRNGNPLQGATQSTYTVKTDDEGAVLTCTITASNAAGTGLPARSKGVTVQLPPDCPRATGALNGGRLGPVKLGMTREQARRAFAHSSSRGKKYQDFFCLTPIGVRVGYASPKLLRTLPSKERNRLEGRVVWASTANEYYALDGIRPGASIAAARSRLKPGRTLHIGVNTWYLAPNGGATAVLKVRHGIVEEIGIAIKSLTTGRKAQLRFMKSFS